MNVIGNSRWVHAMEWSGQNNFVNSPEIPFVVDDSEAGVLKNYGPLSFLKVSLFPNTHTDPHLLTHILLAFHFNKQQLTTNDDLTVPNVF